MWSVAIILGCGLAGWRPSPRGEWAVAFSLWCSSEWADQCVWAQALGRFGGPFGSPPHLVWPDLCWKFWEAPNDAGPVGMGSTVDATGLILKPALNHYFAMLCRLNHVLANNFATIIAHYLTFFRPDFADAPPRYQQITRWWSQSSPSSG